MTAQAGNEGLSFPRSKRCVGMIAFAFWCPASLFAQLGIGGGLIEKNKSWQCFGKEWTAPVDPQLACYLDINTMLLAGSQAFFYG